MKDQMTSTNANGGQATSEAPLPPVTGYALVGERTGTDFGAEIRYVGKPQWLALEDGQPNPAPKSDWHPCVLMIVRPNEKGQR